MRTLNKTKLIQIANIGSRLLTGVVLNFVFRIPSMNWHMIFFQPSAYAVIASA